MPGDQGRRRVAARCPDVVRDGAEPGSFEGGPVDAAVVGCQGVVTIRIPGGESPGEVRVYVRGTYELFVAYTVEALNVGNRVFVHRSRGGRAVDVTSIFTEQ
jgi:hypothetical protein